MDTFLKIMTVLFDLAELVGWGAAMGVIMLTERVAPGKARWSKMINGWSIGTLTMLIVLNLAVWTR